jgi:hypothetical protein
VPNAADCGWSVHAGSPDGNWIERDLHRGIGPDVVAYRVAGAATPADVPVPRMGRIAIHDSTNAVVGHHLVTQTP